jgi:hypothetical protein
VVSAVTRPRVAICAIAKNEGAYLEEWVAYHHLIGFGPIRVYSHESTDDSEEVLARLARHGLVEWQPWSVPPDVKPQWLAYEDGLEQLRERSDWIAFIDLDEFVVMPGHDTIQEFLAQRPELDALAINWKMFGSAGHEHRGPGLVIERFTRCAPRSFGGNRAVKTLARTEAIEIPRVHTCVFAPGVRYETVDGELLDAGVGRSADVSHGVIRLNHYFTRSHEEWLEKAARGRGAKPEGHPKKHRTEAEFAANDRNEELDLGLMQHAVAVRELIDAVRRG